MFQASIYLQGPFTYIGTVWLHRIFVDFTPRLQIQVTSPNVCREQTGTRHASIILRIDRRDSYYACAIFAMSYISLTLPRYHESAGCYFWPLNYFLLFLGIQYKSVLSEKWKALRSQFLAHTYYTNTSLLPEYSIRLYNESYKASAKHSTMQLCSKPCFLRNLTEQGETTVRDEGRVSQRSLKLRKCVHAPYKSMTSCLFQTAKAAPKSATLQKCRWIHIWQALFNIIQLTALHLVWMTSSSISRSQDLPLFRWFVYATEMSESLNKSFFTQQDFLGLWNRTLQLTKIISSWHEIWWLCKSGTKRNSKRKREICKSMILFWLRI